MQECLRSLYLSTLENMRYDSDAVGLDVLTPEELTSWYPLRFLLQ